MSPRLVAPLLAAMLAGAASAQTPPPAPLHIPTVNGEVILPTPRDKDSYDRFGYAQVRRAGEWVYVSGVIVGRRDGEGTDVAAFKDQVRRAFRRLDASLKAAGLGFDDVVMINSFHVWQGPNFAGTRDEQFAAFAQVKAEFMTGPSPAWTAVGTTGLLADGGIVEVQMIARDPLPRR